ncbi:hypothetical protein B0H66DRAFT_529155 [Apodospora peruviana]|uniref:Uncharacterized protein n=1 Tax=Apodospora peruviana TaxID=516989 RepID=A0AAE0MAL3_9PEZI|nr:hypothetical protein B0H66DRAFT_529155 [Apodospora peruviana]
MHGSCDHFVRLFATLRAVSSSSTVVKSEPDLQNKDADFFEFLQTPNIAVLDALLKLGHPRQADPARRYHGLESSARSTEASWSKEQKLLNEYLYDPSQSTPPLESKASQHDASRLSARRANKMHQMHKRDRDQVISRADCQKNRVPNEKVLTMVDQLWLDKSLGLKCKEHQTLTGLYTSSGSCRGCHETNIIDDPDKSGFTEVLMRIKVHPLDDPSSVRSSRDLARLIVSMCSRNYLEIGSPDERFRFSEQYEIAIGNVQVYKVRREASLFEEFTNMILTPEGGRLHNRRESAVIRELIPEQDGNAKKVESTMPFDTESGQHEAAKELDALRSEIEIANPMAQAYKAFNGGIPRQRASGSTTNFDQQAASETSNRRLGPREPATAFN